MAKQSKKKTRRQKEADEYLTCKSERTPKNLIAELNSMPGEPESEEKTMRLIRVIKQTHLKHTSIGLYKCPYCNAEVERTLRNGDRTKSCGCMKNNSENMRPEKYYLGPLCNQGHDYQNTGMSLRYKTDKRCIVCRKMINSKTKEFHESHYKKHDRSEYVLVCVHYTACLEKIKINPRFLMDCPCEDFEYKKDCYKDEIQEQSFGGDTFKSNYKDYTPTKSGGKRSGGT